MKKIINKKFIEKITKSICDKKWSEYVAYELFTKWLKFAILESWEWYSADYTIDEIKITEDFEKVIDFKKFIEENKKDFLEIINQK